jgi:hypothetical protein
MYLFPNVALKWKVAAMVTLVFIAVMIYTTNTSAQGGDSQPPQVNFGTLSVSPQTVGVGDSITASATITDNLSGIRQVEIGYRSPSGHREITFSKFYDQEALLSVSFSDTKNITSFEENGLWSLHVIYVRDHAGNYQYYTRDDITNPDQYDFTVVNTFGPEEKEVAPENGEATVDFPNSDVTITIQTDEPGTITVYRYPTSLHTPPDGAASAGIYLNITPSASLQGKPATFTVG